MSGSLLGLSTYAYFWRSHQQATHPMSLADMLRDTARLDAELFQICDYPPIENATRPELDELRLLATGLGISLELGTRGTRPEHLRSYLDLALSLDVALVRSMWTSGQDRPRFDDTVTRLAEVLPAFEAKGVTLALETYEQIGTAQLVALAETLDSPALGICLDPANTVANLEHPADVTRRCRPYVKNWHVKDFDFTRQTGWVGFSLVGVPLGEGRLNYDAMRGDLDPAGRGINQVIEHWLPWQGDEETTIRLEREWTEHNLTYLRSRNP